MLKSSSIYGPPGVGKNQNVLLVRLHGQKFVKFFSSLDFIGDKSAVAQVDWKNLCRGL